jgi:hypothetical protein
MADSVRVTGSKTVRTAISSFSFGVRGGAFSSLVTLKEGKIHKTRFGVLSLELAAESALELELDLELLLEVELELVAGWELLAGDCVDPVCWQNAVVLSVALNKPATARTKALFMKDFLKMLFFGVIPIIIFPRLKRLRMILLEIQRFRLKV